ncbi:MAG: class I adenylate-forming enzyme family protein [Actinomycetota bacterium]|nr:class I adenylate-forming enzyme family protein [Actinomycetota bacterium]
MTVLEGRPLSGEEGIGALTLGGFLYEVAGRHAEREALVFGDVRWTYAELLQRAERVAAALVAGGTARFSRVGILMGNRPEAVAGLFGAALAGAVAVPISTFSPRPEIGFFLAHSAVDTVLTQVEMRSRRFADDVAALAPDLPYLRRWVAVGDDWEAWLDSGDAVPPALIRARAEQVVPSDEGLIIYSSGTTSQPKGVLHCHRAPTLQFWLQARIFGRHDRTRLWTSLPMFWTAGLNTAMGATLAAGGCWVMQEWFDPGPALELMARERVTEPYTLPHQTAALEEHPGWTTADLSSLRCVFGKSAFARHPSVTNPDTSWNMPVAWGLSETCTGFATHCSSTRRELLQSSSGRLIPGSRLRVVDPDDGRELGPGQVGELTIAGPTVMMRYVGYDQRDCFDPAGFFRTGDVGYFDADGFVHWTGRRSEMIKSAGASVSPAEIEVALRACPPVKLARVLGLPDDRLGQKVVLCVVTKEGYRPDAGRIAAFLKERIAAYKVPKEILFFEDGEIPMTGSDTKVRDKELMGLVLDRLTAGDPKAPKGATT